MAPPSAFAYSGKGLAQASMPASQVTGSPCVTNVIVGPLPFTPCGEPSLPGSALGELFEVPDAMQACIARGIVAAILMAFPLFRMLRLVHQPLSLAVPGVGRADTARNVFLQGFLTQT